MVAQCTARRQVWGQWQAHSYRTIYGSGGNVTYYVIFNFPFLECYNTADAEGTFVVAQGLIILPVGPSHRRIVRVWFTADHLR